jgi:hypothetical protein
VGEHRGYPRWREDQFDDAKVIQLNPLTTRPKLEHIDNGRGKGEIETWIGLLMKANHQLGIPGSAPVSDQEPAKLALFLKLLTTEFHN